MVKILPAEICGYSYQRCKIWEAHQAWGQPEELQMETSVLTSLRAEVSFSV